MPPLNLNSPRVPPALPAPAAADASLHMRRCKTGGCYKRMSAVPGWALAGCPTTNTWGPISCPLLGLVWQCPLQPEACTSQAGIHCPILRCEACWRAAGPQTEPTCQAQPHRYVCSPRPHESTHSCLYFFTGITCVCPSVPSHNHQMPRLMYTFVLLLPTASFLCWQCHAQNTSQLPVNLSAATPSTASLIILGRNAFPPHFN